MPSANEFIVFLVAILALWILLKLVKLAIRVTLFLITLAVVAGLVWFFFVR